VRTTLVALALTAAAVAAQSPSAEQTAEPGIAPPQENPPQSQAPPASVWGGMTAYLGRTVQSIDFPEIPKSEWAKLLELIPQKAGQPLDRDRIRDSILALHDTGRFGDLRVEAERNTEGNVLLHFVTASNYFVGQINVEGTPAHPAANQVANAAKLQLGELFTRDKVSRAVQKIYQLMQENGYYQSTINEEELKHPQTQQVDINLRISPGRQAQVGTIAANGSPGYSIGQIEDIGKIHPGDSVTAQRITNALDRLRKRYQKQNRLLAQVALFSKSYRPEANAVDYVFDINPGPRVEIVTEGFKISRSLLKRNVPVYEENALDDDLLNEGRRNLLNFMQTRGYFDAKVTLQKRSDPNEKQLRVIYIVDPGPRHKLLKVEITGNKVFSDDQLRSRMQVQPAGRFLTHGRYSQGLLNSDIRFLEENPYRYNGFSQVKITPTVIDDYEGRKNELVVKLQIDEGPQTLVAALNIVGNTTTLEDAMPALNTSPGQGFSQTRIAEDREIILNYYFNHGFPDASFEASTQPASDANHIDVTFTIHEGKRVFVDQVFVSGLNYTRPFVVQREIAVKAGDPLSQIDMLNTQKNLYDLGIFSQVDTAIQNPEGNEREKNVLVDVQEAKRYTFNYGIGLEFQTQPAVGKNQPLGQTGVSPRVSFSVTRLNFRGRSHTITFKANAGRLQQRGLLSYEAPRWFNNPDWRLTFTTFYDNTVDVSTFTSERLEGSVQAEQRISKSSVIDYRMTFRRVLATNVAIKSNLIPLLSQPTRVGMPGLSYIRNKRDSDLETTKGNYTTIDGGVADSHFGSEADFSRLLLQNSTYHAFGKNRPQERKYVFARSTRIGIEDVYGNTYIHVPQRTCVSSATVKCPPAPRLIPLPERFFSGGGNSHRGFGLNQAGPRDLTSGYPLGGSALFLNNLELRMPPPTLPFFQENLSFAIFHDAGNVFTDGHDMLHNLLRWKQKNAQACLQQSTASQCDFSYISHAIGVGVRYKTPVGPVRFDFGYNLNPPAFPSFQTNPVTKAQTFVPQHASHFNVFFSIGQTF